MGDEALAPAYSYAVSAHCQSGLKVVKNASFISPIVAISHAARALSMAQPSTSLASFGTQRCNEVKNQTISFVSTPCLIGPINHDTGRLSSSITCRIDVATYTHAYVPPSHNNSGGHIFSADPRPFSMLISNVAYCNKMVNQFEPADVICRGLCRLLPWLVS